MTPPADNERELLNLQQRTWLKHGLLAATFAVVVIYGYLILSGSDPVPEPLRSDYRTAQEQHVKHNHADAYESLKPFKRFEAYENTAFFDRVHQLKKTLKSVLDRRDRIQTAYKNVMSEHTVNPDGNLTPSSADQSLAQLEQNLNHLWETHRNYLQNHPETPPPYQNVDATMLDLLLHRMVRQNTSSEPGFKRLAHYRYELYDRLIDTLQKRVEGSPDDPSYRNRLDFAIAVTDHLNNTPFQQEAEHELHRLRKKIADHFQRIHRKSREAVKKHNFDRALKLYQSNRSVFKNVPPWNQILQNQVNTIRKAREKHNS